MTTTTTRTTTSTTTAALPPRQARWTRLGAGMGYTNTETKRVAIRAAVDAMDWVDPDQVAGVLDWAPVRHLVAGLFYLRRWALSAAAVTSLGDASGLAAGTDGQRRLIGLQSVSGERYVLLDLGYEAIDVMHDRPAVEQVAR
jgi:hypothetical protein